VLTAAVAIFSDGERRAAMSEEIASREQQARLAEASEAKFGKPRLVVKSPRTGGRFGRDSGEFGAPMDAAGASDSGFVPDYTDTAPGFVPAAYNRYGLSDAEWTSLSEKEREALRTKARAEAEQANSPERRSQIAQLRAASARRAGAREGLD
jgi:hypothetical protein